MTCFDQCHLGEKDVSHLGRNFESHHRLPLFLAIFPGYGGSLRLNGALLSLSLKYLYENGTNINSHSPCNLKFLWHFVRLRHCDLRDAGCHRITKTILSHILLTSALSPFWCKVFTQYDEIAERQLDNGSELLSLVSWCCYTGCDWYIWLINRITVLFIYRN